MLLRFAVENWTSFRDRAELSMIAGKERQHGDRLPQIKKYRLRVSPVAAVYGGNASGKTNLFRALAFSQDLIVRGTLPDETIPVEPFMLDCSSTGKPSRFEFVLLVDDVIYEYRFAVTANAVIEESLTRILSTSETTLFSRSKGEFAHVGDTGDLFLDFAFRGTRDNELFLHNAVSQNVAEYRPVWLWFRDCLTLIDPATAYAPFQLLPAAADTLSPELADALAELDTGIARLEAQEIDVDRIGLPGDLLAEVKRQKPDAIISIHDRIRGERYVLRRRDDGTVSARRLVAIHMCSDGTEVEFDMTAESDGTQRVIDLLPVSWELSNPQSCRVFVIDELDRSLHTLLTTQLLQNFLDSASPSTRSQLLFTTHDLLLMDQSLFRRDEMWLTERDPYGATSLFSLHEYLEVRYDKDVRKSYLQGRLGGVPRLAYRLRPEHQEALVVREDS